MIKARTGLFRVIFTFLQVLILSFVIIQSHEISKVGAADTLHITGTVTDQGGNPVSNVSVYATDPGGSTPIDYGTITSNVSGYYDLQLSVAGTYDFHYDPPSGSGLDPIVNKNVSVFSNTTINIQLYPTPPPPPVYHTFSGTLTDTNGNPLVGFNVNIYHDTGNPFTSMNGYGSTDSQGHFSFTAPAGTYERFSISGYSDANNPGLRSGLHTDNATIDMTNGDSTQNLTIQYSTLNVLTKDGSGNPVMAGVSLGNSNNGSATIINGMTFYPSVSGTSAMSDANGQATFRMITGASFDINTIYAVFLFGNTAPYPTVYNSSTVNVSGNTQLLLQQPYIPPSPVITYHTFSGTLTDANGNPLSNFNIGLQDVKSNPTDSVFANGNTDSLGHFSISAPAGTYESFNISGTLASNGTSYFSLTDSNANIDLTNSDVTVSLPFQTAILTVTTKDSNGNPTEAAAALDTAYGTTTSGGYAFNLRADSVSAQTNQNGEAKFKIFNGVTYEPNTIRAIFYLSGITPYPIVYNSAQVAINSDAQVVLQQPYVPPTPVITYHTFSGTLTDSIGNPLSGWNISIDDVKSNPLDTIVAYTTTDAQGNYSISAPSGTYEQLAISRSTNTNNDGSLGARLLDYNVNIDLTNVDASSNFTIPFSQLTVSAKDSSGNPATTVGVSTDGGHGTLNIGSYTFDTLTNYGSMPTDNNGEAKFSVISNTTFDAGSIRVVFPPNPINPMSTQLQNGSPITVNGDTRLVFVQSARLSAPTNVQVSTPTQLPILTWNTVTNAVAYYVYRDGQRVYSGTDTTYMDSTAPEGNHTYYVSATAYSFESPKSDTLSVFVNKTAPTTTASLSPSTTTADYYPDPVTVTLNASSPHNEVSIANTYFSVDGGPQLTYSAPFLVSGPGSHTIVYWSVDNTSIGEIHNSKSFTIVAPPSINPLSNATLPQGATLSQNGGFSSGASDWTATVDYGDGSGVQNLPLSGTNFTLSHTYVQAGSFTVSVTVTDNFNISSTETAQITVIVGAPTNLSAASPTQNPNLTWDGNQYATSYNIYRNNSKIGSSTNTSFNDTSAPEGTNSYYVTAVFSGFESTPSNTINVLVNRTAPTSSITLSPNPYTDGSYQNPVTTTLTATAARAGIAVTNTYYTVDGGTQQTYTNSFVVTGFGNHTVSYWSVDNSGVVEIAKNTSFNIHQPPVVQNLTNATINEGSVFTQNGAFTSSASSWTATVNYGDGSGVQNLPLSGTNFILSHVYAENGSYTVSVIVTDNLNTTGTSSASVTVNNVAPTIGTISASASTVKINTATTLSASFTDPGTLDTHSANWNWGDGTSSTATLTENNGSGSVSNNHTYTATGLYTVTLSLSDDDGATTSQTYMYISVYNPTLTGLFSGAANFTSPTGAFTANPTLIGQVHFGVNVKYDKSDNPTGNVNMNFTDANLDFNSTSIDLMVISGANATVRGKGAINGVAGYTFLVTGIAGTTSDPGDIRYQIKDAAGSVVYDTQPGASDTAAPSLSVLGKIVVQ